MMALPSRKDQFYCESFRSDKEFAKTIQYSIQDCVEFHQLICQHWNDSKKVYSNNETISVDALSLEVKVSEFLIENQLVLYQRILNCSTRHI